MLYKINNNALNNKTSVSNRHKTPQAVSSLNPKKHSKETKIPIRTYPRLYLIKIQ